MSKILVVDDDAPTRNIYQLILAEAHYDSDVCADAFEALAMLFGAWREYDVIIMDMVMPGLDGATTVRIIRSIEGAVTPRARRKIILSTGFSPDLVGVERIMQAADCDGFLGKPVDRDVLLEAIHDQLIYNGNGQV